METAAETEIDWRDKLKFGVFFLFVVFTLSISIYYDLHEMISVEAIQNYIEASGLWGPLIYVVAYMVTSIFFFPATLLSMAGGLVWGPYLGTLLTVLAATASAILPFFISRLLGRDFVARLESGNLAGTCDRFLSRNGFTSVFIIRLIPLFPWDMVNYAGGLCGIRFRDYFFATLLGIIPASFTYNMMGASLGEPFSWGRIGAIAGMVVLLAGLVTGYKLYKHNQK